MRVTRVSVSLEKRANDGDYGSEKSEVEVFADLEPGDEAHTVLDWLMATARFQVEHDLLQSPNLKVRQALIRKVRRCNRCNEPLADEDNGYLHAACDAAEREEREERYQRQKAEQEERWKRAEESAELELAAGRRDNARGDDDDEDEGNDEGLEAEMITSQAAQDRDIPF